MEVHLEISRIDVWVITVSFRLSYCTLCGDVNLTTFYNVGKENQNISCGI